MIELRHLRYAIAVAEERHVTRAAERLGLQQPPLSQQIRALEREIGTPLFRRLPRGVEPTAAGLAFVERARLALREVEAALDVARRAGRGEAGQLAVGFTSSASFHPLVSDTVRLLRASSPALRLALEEASSGLLLDSLRASRLDAAFLRIPVRAGEGLGVLPLVEEEMVVALPERHPLLARWTETDRLPLAALAAEEFILYHRPNGPGLYDGILAACARAGFSPHIGQEASHMIATLGLVAAGLGLSLVPASIQRLGMAGVTYRHLDRGDAPIAPLALAWRQGEDSGPLARLIGKVRERLRADAPAGRA